jgi:membrane peptidoglycan carboxypeptidase
VSPLTVANAYATFAARGRHCEPRAIKAVRSATEDKLEVAPPLCDQAFEPAVADAVNEILSEVIDGPNPNRTGAAMSLGRPAGGKTGTTSFNTAVWFAGYTPDLAAAVWAGHPDAPADYPMEDVTINGLYYPTVYGSLLPGPIWKQAMLGALAGTKASSFVAIDPSQLAGEQGIVPAVSGLTPAEAVKKLSRAGFVPVVASEAVDSSQAKGFVAYTDPVGGSRGITGTTVTIYVSTGTPPPPDPEPTKTTKPTKPQPTPSPTSSDGGNPGQGGGNPGQGGGNPGGGG